MIFDCQIVISFDQESLTWRPSTDEDIYDLVQGQRPGQRPITPIYFEY